jgi:hypothetical protein
MDKEEFLIYGFVFYKKREQKSGLSPYRKYRIAVIEQGPHSNFSICKITPLELGFNCSFKMTIHDSDILIWQRAYWETGCIYKSREWNLIQLFKK